MVSVRVKFFSVFNPVRCPRRTDADLKEVQKRASEHQIYLRRLKFKTCDKLERSEREKIQTYIDKTSAWVDRIRNSVDLNDFMFAAFPLLRRIEELTSEVVDEVKTTHSLKRVGRVDRKEALALENSIPVAAIEAAPLANGGVPAQALTKTGSKALTTVSSSYSSNWAASSTMSKPNVNSIDTQVNVMRSESHVQLAMLYRDMERLCEYYLNLYGNVRGSGDVVSNPHVPVASVAPPNESDNQIDPWVISGRLCPDCGVVRVVNTREACASCPECGVCVPYQEADLKAYNYGDEPEIKKLRRRNYKPESYAALWLRKVSGKLGVEVPEDVITKLFAEFHSKRFEKVDPKIVRKTLQRNNLTEYYKCVPFLTYKFNEVPLAEFSDEEQLILEQMFEEYREAFHRCPFEIKRRSNLMSYAYFYYKSVEIRGWFHYMKCFPLLEGDDHIRQHDKTWKWICENKNGEKWAFFPTRIG